MSNKYLLGYDAKADAGSWRRRFIR